MLHLTAKFSFVLIILSGCSLKLGGVPGGDAQSGGGGSASVAGVGGSSSQGGQGGQGGQSSGQGGSQPSINVGFIGGPCQSDMDCDYEGGRCLGADLGFPEGMCSLDCSKYCPDADGMVTTFCATPEGLGTTPSDSAASEGLCTTRCDYGQSDTGCRAGYQCQRKSRYNEPETETYVCVPGTDDPFALNACHQDLLQRGVAFSPAVNPDDKPDGIPDVVCKIPEPVWVAGTIGSVNFRPSSPDNAPRAMLSSCENALAMAISTELMEELDISDVVHYGIYNCRVISGTKKLSQHGMANAIDIAGLKMSSGEYYTVLNDWEKDQPNPATTPGKLLYDFADGLHQDHTYNIILTPNYNEAHADHFHCDLTPGSHTLN